MQKEYLIDSSVLIDNPKSIEILRNGEENNILLSYETILELDGLKKNTRLNYIVRDIIDELIKYKDIIKIIDSKDSKNKNDTKILDDILYYLNKEKQNNLDFIFVTNDKMLSFRANYLKIKTQEFKDSYPYQSESQKYTGFVEDSNNLVNNCFYFQDGKLKYYTNNTVKDISYQNELWSIKPRTIYQNAAMELLLDESLDVVSIQSSAGYGKSTIALAAGLHWILQKKQYDKMYIFKHTVDVGNEELGFLPGVLSEKISPYFRPIYDLLIKLHNIRDANRIFVDIKSPILELNTQKVEFLPINFIRGMNIDNAFVVIDEIQNLSRQEVKIILSRMGENTRVVCIGDVEQIDNNYLNQDNNGMSWLVKCFKGLPNYGHVVLKGKNSRGPIADMVRNSQL